MLQKIHPTRNSNINSFRQATNKDGMCDWQFGRIYLMLAWILGFSDVIFKFIFTSYFQKNQPFIGYVKKRGLVKKKKTKTHDIIRLLTFLLPCFPFLPQMGQQWRVQDCLLATFQLLEWAPQIIYCKWGSQCWGWPWPLQTNQTLEVY